MKLEPIEWKEEFNVGCDYVDEAHRKLFGVMRKIVSLLGEEDESKNRHACCESIKYMQSYTIKHFAEEEAFQREIGYAGYEMHKKLHDNLREVTLPAMVADLEENDFSTESIERFLAVLAGWLTGHIMIEDRAITGKVSGRWNKPADVQAEDLLQREFIGFMKDMCGLNVSLYNGLYEADPIKDAVYYIMNFEEKMSVAVIMQQRIVLHMARIMLGIDVHTIDKVVMAAFVQVAQSMARGSLGILYPQSNYTLKSHLSMEANEFKRKYSEGYPEYSMEFKCEEGFLALCVEKN